MLTIPAMPEVPIWVLALVFVFGNMTKSVFPFFDKWISNDRNKKDLEKCLHDCTLLIKKNEENEILIGDMKSQLSNIEGKLTMLRQMLAKEGFEIEI